jgi:CheY-like chemotaxis protein
VPATVLIIDDDSLMRSVVRDMLKAAGFNTLEAADGAEGVERARHGRPDVILLDVIMPEMDGYTTCERLKADELTKAIPVIFVTVTPDRTLNRRAYALGAFACVPKPFRREALLAVVQTALAKTPPRRPKG